MAQNYCGTEGCTNRVANAAAVFCNLCIDRRAAAIITGLPKQPQIDVAEGMGPVEIQEYKRITDTPLHVKYPKYHKAIPKGLQSLDVYTVCFLFPVDDPSGCINHARKKLLVPGVRTGGKSMYKDIEEARDTLNRWLQLNTESVPLGSPESFKK